MGSLSEYAYNFQVKLILSWRKFEGFLMTVFEIVTEKLYFIINIQFINIDYIISIHI